MSLARDGRSTRPNAFPIVGVGASAGGVEALEGLLRGLPREPGLALVVVTHLSPDRESLLHEILERFTDLPVRVCEEGMEVENNQIYVMPADVVLTIQDRRLHLHDNNGRPGRKPIDIFLSSLAVDVGELSGGVILSGGDSDGTLGVKTVKERGGITFAQVGDGFGPRHPNMPDAAISSGLIDFALPVEEIGAKLAEFVRGVLPANDDSDGDGAVMGGDQSIEASLRKIYEILRKQVSHDFSGYKTKTFTRRVERRMQINQIRTVESYVERLKQEPQEVAALFRDLLINVTNFFRDEDAFETLATTVIPELFEERGADDTVRVWVPGCATGEEVFSIAILMRERMERLAAVPRVQIFATDIDERALGVARAARYPAPLLDGVSPERRERFFRPDGESYVVTKDVRELCAFSPHSVIRDPPFSRIDLVSCRNLLIYFGGDVQNQVIPVFHYALRPEGFLFLGSAENVNQFGELFTPIDKRHRIFRRRSNVAPVRLPILLHGLRAAQTSALAPRRLPLVGRALRQAVDEQVLERFSPPHVVVNRDGDVVYYSTRTGKYLEAPPGAPTHQLLTMVRKGLRLDLRALFGEAVQIGRPASRDRVAVEIEEGRVQIVNLRVEPLDLHAPGEPLFLVLFSDQGPSLSREEALSRAESTQDGVAAESERELRETRDRLQSMMEEYGTALEELKSSNEELVSVNEEMQSTNEELESSKEELQSINEELHTVNVELSGKIEALDRANSDLRNLFESTDLATVFLDRNLGIRSFTPAITRMFNIRSIDKGRPVTELSSKLDLEGFTDDIQNVLATGVALERRVDDDDQSAHYLVRLVPYRNLDREIEGVVVTFIDVTSLTRAEARQRVLIGELQHRTRNLLSVVKSIAQKTLGKGGSFDGFTDRLSAIGRVQSLVGGSQHESIDLQDVVRLELEALSAPDSKVSATGPSVALDVELVQTLGLALHELGTNALKHGALKGEAGRLDIAWRVEPDGEDGPILILDWVERDVPNLQPPSRKGFGLDLIEKALPFTLRAKTNLNFRDDGVSCRIELPLSRPSMSDP